VSDISSLALVSVVVPTYNRGHLLPDAIKSIENQTYSKYEIIVVDDGSTDDTEAVCKDLNVIYIKQENAGASAARNTGIRKCNGEFVAFLDSDDVWHPKKLEKQVGFFQQHPECGLVHTDTEVVGVDESYSFSPVGYQRFEKIRHIESVVLNPYFGMPTVMIPKHVLDEIGLFDESIATAEDLDLFLRIAMRYPVGYMNETMLVVRKGEDNLSGGADSYEDNEYVFTRFFQKNNEYFKDKQDIYKAVFYRLNIKYAKYLLFYKETRKARGRVLKALKCKLNKELVLLYIKTLVPVPVFNAVRKIKNLL